MTTDHAATEPTPLDVDREAHQIIHGSPDQTLTSAAAVTDTTRRLKVAMLLVVIALALVYAIYGNRLTGSQSDWIFASFAGLVIVGLLVVWLVAWTRARRRLRREISLPLTQRVWLSGIAGNWPYSFDARLWISETGPAGPRIINLGPKPIEVNPDPDAHEEIDIATELARTLVRSPSSGSCRCCSRLC